MIEYILVLVFCTIYLTITPGIVENYIPNRYHNLFVLIDLLIVCIGLIMIMTMLLEL